MTSTEAGQGIEAKSPEIYELVEEGSAVEQVATGFTFTEGPIWHPDGTSSSPTCRATCGASTRRAAESRK